MGASGSPPGIDDITPGLCYQGKQYAEQHVADSYLGPPFVGFMVHFVLFGLFAALFIDYIGTPNYRHESRTNRALVWACFVMSGGITVGLAWQTLYHGLNQVSGRGQLSSVGVDGSC